MAITIRKGQKKDLPAVHQLVCELATYEKANGEVTASLEDYEQDFEANIFETLVAEEEGVILGMMLYYMTYSTWKGRMLYLEDFVITQSQRQRGIGQLLFNAFLGEARKKKAVLAKWQVLDWNEPAVRFYEKNGAQIEKEWWTVKVFM
ncbi:MAG: GNAT family N-acetyltransferase [Bacteroidota bacterium]